MAQDLGGQLQSLYGRFGHLAGVHFELHQNLIAVYVQTAKAEARVFLQGAQLSHFQPAGQKPVLWMSEHNQFKPGQPLRGGIPISWPWFADLARNPQAVAEPVTEQLASQAHGFVRNSLWQLDDLTIVDEVCTLELSLQVDQPGWPFPARLSLTLVVDQQLSISLGVENLGDQAFSYTLALHSYFSVADINQVTVEGLAGGLALDCVDHWQPKPITEPVTVTDELDWVIEHAPEQVVLVDDVLDRRIRLSHSGLPSLVAWNPWQDKGSRLSQFGAEDYQTMLCLESAALLSSAVLCAPGQCQRHNLFISVG